MHTLDIPASKDSKMYLYSFAAVIGNHVYQQLEDWQIEKGDLCQKEKALLVAQYMLVVWHLFKVILFEKESTISLH